MRFCLVHPLVEAERSDFLDELSVGQATHGRPFLDKFC
jgi:hypothetical protein